MLRAFLCILSYILCDWNISMRNTKHELSTINMFYSPQKIVILPHFLLSPRWPLWRGSTACYTFYRANANLHFVRKQETQLTFMAPVPRNFVQSEARVMQLAKKMISFNVGGKTRNIAFQVVLWQCCKTKCTF